MSFSTSSLVTSLHSVMVVVVLCGTSYRGVAAVDARTASTLSLKKVAKSSAVCTSLSAGGASPSTPLNVRHSLLESPLLAAISSRQNLVFLCSYRARIDRSNPIHVRLSSSRILRRNRLSAALACRRAARQSASNHDVFCLALRRTLAAGQ